MTDSDKLVDFDSFRAEQEAAPVHLRIDGEMYELPPALPAAVAVGVIRLKTEMAEDDDVPLDTLDKFGRSIFGGELWETVLDRHRITTSELPKLLSMVLEVYGHRPKEESPT